MLQGPSCFLTSTPVAALGQRIVQGRVGYIQHCRQPAPDRGIRTLGSAFHCCLTIVLHQICISVHPWPLPQMSLARGHLQLHSFHSLVLPQHSTMLGMCLKQAAPLRRRLAANLYNRNACRCASTLKSDARKSSRDAGAQDHTATQKVCPAPRDALPEVSNEMQSFPGPVCTTASC